MKRIMAFVVLVLALCVQPASASQVQISDDGAAMLYQEICQIAEQNEETALRLDLEQFGKENSYDTYAFAFATTAGTVSEIFYVNDAGYVSRILICYDRGNEEVYDMAMRMLVYTLSALSFSRDEASELLQSMKFDATMGAELSDSIYVGGLQRYVVATRQVGNSDVTYGLMAFDE